MINRMLEVRSVCALVALLAATNAAYGAGFYSPSVGSPGSLGTAGVPTRRTPGARTHPGRTPRA